MSFWYGARSLKEVFYEEEFDNELAETNDNFEWHLALSEPQPEDNWTGLDGIHPPGSATRNTCRLMSLPRRLRVLSLRSAHDELAPSSACSTASECREENILLDDFGG